MDTTAIPTLQVICFHLRIWRVGKIWQLWSLPDRWFVSTWEFYECHKTFSDLKIGLDSGGAQTDHGFVLPFGPVGQNKNILNKLLRKMTLSKISKNVWYHHSNKLNTLLAGDICIPKLFFDWLVKSFLFSSFISHFWYWLLSCFVFVMFSVTLQINFLTHNVSIVVFYDHLMVHSFNMLLL